MGEVVTLGAAEAVPEQQMKVFAVGTRRIVVARVSGSLYAFDDECTHAACSLGDGELEGLSVVCPCHMGQFDLTTGQVIDGPPPDPITTYPVHVSGGMLTVDLG